MAFERLISFNTDGLEVWLFEPFPPEVVERINSGVYFKDAETMVQWLGLVWPSWRMHTYKISGPAYLTRGLLH